MAGYRRIFSGMIVALGLLLVSQASGQNIAARLSSEQGYVGMPVILEIQIRNAGDYELPEKVEVAGCSVASAGTPRRSSHIAIINGRRTESHTVVIRYLITPRSEGEFKVPAIVMKVDGREQRTNPLPFSATKSETGDLLFVEVEGDKDVVYVGEQLALTLKIWIKPFADRKQQVVLSEGNMWQLLAPQTTWGAFEDRVYEMANDRQRPRGQEVLRKDASGEQVKYYLYEIETTTYPARPGKIDASGVQIIFQYPTSLGRRRSRMDSMFRDPFADSLLNDMMNDSFFGSPFADRLEVTGVRPIVGIVELDATKVIDVPQEGRPDDYRGAVGNYRIRVDAAPKDVQAGDSITLRMEVSTERGAALRGRRSSRDGLLDRLQPPPIDDFEKLTKDFKVSDQWRGGVVLDNGSKVFLAKVRPRDEGVQEIPAIPFSFFDPEQAAYRTVSSAPIPISVSRSETLSLDAVVDGGGGPAGQPGDKKQRFDLSVNSASSVLQTMDAPAASRAIAWWHWFVLLPPMVWLGLAGVRLAPSGNAWRLLIDSIRPSRHAALIRLRRAATNADVADAVVKFIQRRTKTQRDSSGAAAVHAVGALRSIGLMGLAAKSERLLLKLEQSDDVRALDVELQGEASQLISELDSILRRTPRMRSKASTPASPITGSLVGIAIGLAPLVACHAEFKSTPQHQSLLQEAVSAYQEGVEASDAAEARDAFELAAMRFQQLVDLGVRNDLLHLNLGNAHLQLNSNGQAILNYHRALALAPNNRRALANLAEARRRVRSQPAAFGEATTSLQNWLRPFWLQLGIAVGSIGFWSSVCMRTIGFRFHLLRFAAGPFLLMCVCGGALLWLQIQRVPRAVAVSDTIVLRDGDGEEFSVVQKLADADGREFRLLDVRQQWAQVQTETGAGWAPFSEIAVVEAQPSGL